MYQGILKRLGKLRGQRKDAQPLRLIDHPQLRPKIRRLVEAVGDRMFPSGGAIPYSGRDVGLTEYMMEFLAKIPQDKSNMLCGLMLAYEYAFPLLHLKGFRFTGMSEAEQTRLLEEMQESPWYAFRILNTVVRMFMTFGYLADERVLAEMGYFKMHEYPQDPRIIQILKDLPWEMRSTEGVASVDGEGIATPAPEPEVGMAQAEV